MRYGGHQQPNRRAQNSPTLASPRRRRAMSDAGDSPSLPVLPDEILGDIFLCLDAADELARVSAAGKSYRRVVYGPRFLRRFRFLHTPPVLGFFESWESGGFHHAEPPRRSASAARAISEAADFTCSFLPDPGTWKIRDASCGRLLLCSHPADTKLTSWTSWSVTPFTADTLTRTLEGTIGDILLMTSACHARHYCYSLASCSIMV
ncbi:hypothetical protein BS78_08G141600 [Paspalum vaginatum]|nr:hypothetical protein BS78_08G141600 [Paspalum vaginatum]